MDADGDAAAELAALKEALAAQRAKTLEVAADLAVARAKASEDQALIAYQKLRIAKLERQIYGQRSERAARLIEQLALAFEEEFEAGATEDRRAAEQAAAKTTTVRGFTRKRAERQTFPEHLPRERVVVDPPRPAVLRRPAAAQDRRGRHRTLDFIPRRWKVTRRCARGSAAATADDLRAARAVPWHPAGRIGASLLAMIMVDKYGAHQPLNRQTERYAREGVPIALSTMADAWGRSAPARAVASPPGGSCPRRRAAARGRHDRAGAGQRQDDTGRCWAMSATTDPSAAPARRRRSSTTRATAAANTPNGIWPATPASCRPTPMTATPRSTRRDGPRGHPRGPLLGPCTAAVLCHTSPRLRCGRLALIRERRRAALFHQLRNAAVGQPQKMRGPLGDQALLLEC